MKKTQGEMYFLVSGVILGQPGKHHFAIRAEDRKSAATALRRQRPNLLDVTFLAWKLLAAEKWYGFEVKRKAIA